MLRNKILSCCTPRASSTCRDSGGMHTCHSEVDGDAAQLVDGLRRSNHAQEQGLVLLHAAPSSTCGNTRGHTLQKQAAVRK
jgi:hypothetical protein